MLFRPREKPDLASRLRNALWPRGGPARGWRYIGYRVRRIAASPHAVALGFAIGAFASFTPFIGFHMALAAALAFFSGGSILASAFGTLVGNPFTYPLIWVTTYDLGGLLLGGETRDSIDLRFADGTFGLLFHDPAAFWRAFWHVLEPVVWPMTVGAMPLGLAAAVFCYGSVRWAIGRYRERQIERLRARQP
ncbi:MAG: DUF2062 domain-containing protein [Parvibaculaceae bacterium]